MAALSVRVKWMSLPASVTSLWTMSSQAGIFGPPLAPAYVASPAGSHITLVCACAMFASPKHASAMPARPTPNFFSAARRVTDWARFLVISSNWLFMFFLSFWFCLFVVGMGYLRLEPARQFHLPANPAEENAGYVVLVYLRE